VSAVTGARVTWRFSVPFADLHAPRTLAVSTTMAGDDAGKEEMYSSWSLFIVCLLLILSLWTSYYLQIKRIRAVNETLVSIFAGMFVGLLVRVGPASMIRDMLVRVF